ncbi:hypothetical protein BU23DRAFT_558313 [Bimuria novae-zelandiae CBS 107.79]|uniref:Uncharacterized protein n=1 Tax=Bimuria novae-zelandiae CBS 107.79 TaxID=1447943 RepID=A0A6A5V629_9PLEO|nr:hypothetical protein BU23DRAFT_558313 [Bimuria novae-zelandiae CBS 107.79]
MVAWVRDKCAGPGARGSAGGAWRGRVCRRSHLRAPYNTSRLQQVAARHTVRLQHLRCEPVHEAYRDIAERMEPTGKERPRGERAAATVLITSRNKDAAARLAGGYNKIKEVLAMDESV